MKSAATKAFDFPTSDSLSYQILPVLKLSAYLKRNWRFKLDISIVSISITWISPNPADRQPHHLTWDVLRAKFCRISHPKPPAPITRILTALLNASFAYSSARPLEKGGHTAWPPTKWSSVHPPFLSSTVSISVYLLSSNLEELASERVAVMSRVCDDEERVKSGWVD
jgi:hypothetical protein